MARQKCIVIFPTSWGFFELILTSRGVYSLRRVKKISKATPCFTSIPERVKLYLEGIQQEDFQDITVDWEGYSPGERKVLETVRNIPYGKTESYRQVAERSGFPGKWRWVGHVLGKNRIPLIIPCHRVVKSNGEIGGFSWGVGWKKRLLALESGKCCRGRRE